MAGISSKAAGTIQNKEKTFQGQRFDDDLGLNWIQFKWRNHDPQIGRFIEVDPLSEKYAYNSTYAFSENKVTGHVELEGLEAAPTEDKRPYPSRIPKQPAGSFPQGIPTAPLVPSSQGQKPNNESKSNNPKDGNKPTTSTSSSDPLVGQTTTNKMTKGGEVYNLGTGDKLEVSTFVGKVSGKPGRLITTDASTSNGTPDGASVTIGGEKGALTLGYTNDGSLTIGVGAYGFETHVGIGLNRGVNVTGGSSFSDKNNIIKGGDITVGVGPVTVATVFAVRAISALAIAF
jgi:RHS repeat-associated protein